MSSLTPSVGSTGSSLVRHSRLQWTDPTRRARHTGAGVLTSRSCLETAACHQPFPSRSPGTEENNSAGKGACRARVASLQPDPGLCTLFLSRRLLGSFRPSPHSLFFPTRWPIRPSPHPPPIHHPVCPPTPPSTYQPVCPTAIHKPSYLPILEPSAHRPIHQPVRPRPSMNEAIPPLIKQSCTDPACASPVPTHPPAHPSRPCL